MKVKMLVTMVGEKEVKNIGDEIEVRKEVAEAWQKAGIAEIVQKENKPKKGEK